jgi:hypothetical protein
MNKELSTTLSLSDNFRMLHGIDTRYNGVKDTNTNFAKNIYLKNKLDILENPYVSINTKLKISNDINYKSLQFCLYNGGLFTNTDFTLDDFKLPI